MSASGLPTEAERARKVAIDAATAQFRKMPTSNRWDIAQAVVRALEAAGLVGTSEPLELLRKIVAWIDAYGGHPVYEREIRALVAEAATREGAAMAFREPLGESPPPHEDQRAVVPTSATSEPALTDDDDRYDAITDPYAKGLIVGLRVELEVERDDLKRQMVEFSLWCIHETGRYKKAEVAALAENERLRDAAQGVVHEANGPLNTTSDVYRFSNAMDRLRAALATSTPTDQETT